MAARANRLFRTLNSRIVVHRAAPLQQRALSATAAAAHAPAAEPSPTPSSHSSLEPDKVAHGKGEDDTIFVKGPKSASVTRDRSSASMPISFYTGSIAGKRFYKDVTTRLADDGNGWTVMLDYRTLKTPSKRVLRLPTLALAKAIAAEWEYQQTDGIRPFTMPLMKLACTALERVPVTRMKTIDHLMQKFHQDLVFCRSPGGSEIARAVLERQIAKIDPLLKWVEKEFGHKPVVYTCLFGGRQDDTLVKAIENALKQTNDYELTAVDALAAAAHSLIISLGLVRGKLRIGEAIELVRLEENFQIDRFGLVEGGHDVDIADLQVQISSAVVFLELSRRD